MVLIVLVQPGNMDHIVLNAQLQDTGMIKQINVFAIHHSFGTVKIVYAQHHISYTKEDVQTVQLDTNGNKIDVKNASVLSKI